MESDKKDEFRKADTVLQYGNSVAVLVLPDGNPNPKHRQIPSAQLLPPQDSPLVASQDAYMYNNGSMGGRLGKLFERHGERMCSMGAVDILRESAEVIKSNSPLLLYLTALFLCPVSLLLLSRPLLRTQHYGGFTAALFRLLHRLLPVKPLYESASHALVSFTVAVPLLLTLWLLAKASISSAIYAAYSSTDSKPRHRPRLVPSIATGARSWKRASLTYVWICAALLASGWAAAALFYLLTSLASKYTPPDLALLLAHLALAMTYSLAFSHIVLLGNLATTISIFEDHACGLSAIVQSFHLLKGKLHMALTLLFLCTFITGVVETLYQYRVLGIPASRYAITAASRAWEGPLLLLMHSFLLLFDVVSGCVLYFVCKLDGIHTILNAIDCSL